VAPAIRPIAICVFRRDACILVGHARDVVKNEHYCRPPGGAIEFGERALEALRREIREELHTEIEAPELLGVLENTFQLEGKARHEIVFVFQARFVDPAFYELHEVPLYEPGWDGRLTWESLEGFRTSQWPLYPEGLRDLIDARANDDRSRSGEP
jgi:ADP-ribose pyrophosphatase YjhB (NUDIX family)